MRLCSALSLLSLETAALGALLPPLQPRFNLGGVTRDTNDPLWIMGINDDHANMMPFAKGHSECPMGQQDGCIGGYANYVGTAQEVLNQHGHSELPTKANTLWLQAGDQGLGTAMYVRYKQQIIPVVDRIAAFDAMVPGNHDWDETEPALLKIVEATSDMTWLAANVKFGVSKLNDLFKPFKIYHDKKVVLMGLATPETKIYSKTDVNTVFEEPLDAAVRTWREIKKELEGEGLDIDDYAVGALTHIGHLEDQKLARGMQKQGLRLDFIHGGHSHTGLGNMIGQARPHHNQGVRSGDLPAIIESGSQKTCIMTSGYKGRYLAFMKLTYKNGKLHECKGRGVEVRQTNKMTNKKLQETLEEKFQHRPSGGVSINEMASTKIGTSLGNIPDMPGRFDGESLMGNFLADSMLYYTREKSAESLKTVQRRGKSSNTPKTIQKPALAFIPAGTLRATLFKGGIWETDLSVMQPFADKTIISEMSPQDLWKTFQGVYAKKNLFDGEGMKALQEAWPMVDDVFLHFSQGVEVVFNEKEPIPTQRLKSVKINGIDLRKWPEETIVFATTSWLMQGKEGIVLNQDYEKLNNNPAHDLGVHRDAIRAYIKHQCQFGQKLHVQFEGRIRNLGNDKDNKISWGNEGEMKKQFEEKAKEAGVYVQQDSDPKLKDEIDPSLLKYDEIFADSEIARRVARRPVLSL